jgi:hypothetical protein
LSLSAPQFMQCQGHAGGWALSAWPVCSWLHPELLSTLEPGGMPFSSAPAPSWAACPLQSCKHSLIHAGSSLAFVLLFGKSLCDYLRWHKAEHPDNSVSETWMTPHPFALRSFLPAHRCSWVTVLPFFHQCTHLWCQPV